MFFNHRKETEQGFTLTELLVVILIIGILAAIAIPLFLNQRKAAREAALKEDLKNAATQVEGGYDAKTQKYKTPLFESKSGSGDGDTDEGTGGTENGEGSEDGTFGPVFTSEGNNVSFKAMGEQFCLTGFHQDDADNLWYFSSIDGKLSKNPRACLDGVDEAGGEESEGPSTGANFQCTPIVKQYIDLSTEIDIASTPAYRLLQNQRQRGIITQAQLEASPEAVALKELNEEWEVLEEQIWWYYTTETNAWQDEYVDREEYSAELGVYQKVMSAASTYANKTASYNASRNITASGAWAIDPSIIQADYEAFANASAEHAAVMCGNSAVKRPTDRMDAFFALTPLTGLPACHANVLTYNNTQKQSVAAQNAEYMFLYFRSREGVITPSENTRYQQLKSGIDAFTAASNTQYQTLMNDAPSQANWREHNLAMNDTGYSNTFPSSAFNTYTWYVERLVMGGETQHDAKAEELYQNWKRISDHWYYVQCGQ